MVGCELRARRPGSRPDDSQSYSKAAAGGNRVLWKDRLRGSLDDVIMKRRTKITIETERLLVISRRQTSARSWCSNCRSQVKFLPAETAAKEAGLSSRAVYRLVETAAIDFLETADGSLLVCRQCLALHLKNEETREY